MFYVPTNADVKERGNGLARVIRPGSSDGVALTGGYAASLQRRKKSSPILCP